MPKTNEVVMKVPEDMLAEMQAYMERLKLTVNKKTCKQEGEEGEENFEFDFECEVNGVFDHRISSEGVWQFLVGWKNCRKKEWVNDQNCNCEIAISTYLRQKNIRSAYLFCRVSTPEQATAVNVSLEAQESELRAATQKLQGFDRIRSYAISQSAFKNIPKILLRIGEACLPGDGIFVWRVDRLSRNIVNYLSWMEELNKRGVHIYSHQENLVYADNKLDFLQAVLDAQREASLLGERVKLSYRLKRERGDEKVGRLPYGKKYHRILRPDGGTLKKIVVDNPEEIDIIKRICKSKYNSATDIAKQLNDEGIKKQGRKWTRLSVIRIHKQKY
jgi:DNA invertase Pin-like site-specific DNA recombinase